MIEVIEQNIFFIVFSVVVLGVLLVDLLLVGKNKHIITVKESLLLTFIWLSLSIGFYLFIRFYGDHIHQISTIEKLKAYASIYSPHVKINTNNFHEAAKIYREAVAMDYLAGYFLEYTLSLDNIFVILMILTSFSVDPKNYKTVLFWGILGAIILRFIFIFAGATLITKFEWILYIFGFFLVFSGIKMFVERNKKETIEVNNHWIVKFLSKHFKIHPQYINGNFWIKINGVFYFTPLFVVLLMIEFTDLIFAVDSIPAIFSITRDPYIVFFSNIFAIIGLRSLFFLIANIIDLFHYLKVGVSILLTYVGVKLIFHHWLDEIGFENIYSLFFILAVLILSILASLLHPKKMKQ